MGAATTGDAVNAQGNPEVCARILAMLDEAGVAYRATDHGIVTSSEAAAELRGTDLKIGGKSLLLKADDGFHVVAFSAATRMKSRLFRRAIGSRRLRFATPEELAQLTGLVPGCVPPFGRPILPFTLHADRALVENDHIAFTPGVRTRSIVMESAAWARLAKPQLGDFTEPA
jgi:Ala-tRNA(Pro) deacylase